MTPQPTSWPVAGGEPLLSVRDLRVGFRDRGGEVAVAVAGLSVDVPAGGSLAIVGESGSGKTVSMRALLGLLPETAQVEGAAYYGGRDLFALAEPELRAVRGRGIGMVFQNAMEALNPTRTLKVQLTEHLRWHRICSRAEATRRAIEALDRVGIPEAARRVRMYPFQLSGGMRQRAMIAMAIIAGPRLLIADEPTTAVDVTIQRQVLEVLKQLRDDGLAIIMITHDLGVARYFCDDIVVMKEGHTVELAPMETFVTDAAAPYSRQLLDAALDIDTSGESPSRTGTHVEQFPDTGVSKEGRPGFGASGEQPNDGSEEGSSQQEQLLRPEHDRLLVHAADLVKIFLGRGGDVHAVTDVSLTIAAGETVGVVGESGSGKSTLARLLVRLIEPTSGTVTIDGHDILTAKRAELRDLRRRIQMVFQNPYGSLLPHLTVAANIAEPLRVHKIGTPAERRAHVIELLDMVGISRERADQYPRQFSGGQQQRIAIARALVLEPQLLVCDEPTSALDVSIQAQVLDLLQDLQHRLGLSMLFITHNLAVAQRLCDRIVVMATGRIMETAPTAQLFTDPKHPYTQALLAAVLPVRGEPLPWQQDTTVDTTTAAGDLVEVSPQHWVRITTNGTSAHAGDVSQRFENPIKE